MENKYVNNFKDGYYRIFLNCDDEIFKRDENKCYDRGRLYYTSDDGSKKYCTSVYCKLVDGRAFDVITNREYTYALPSEKEEYDTITYWGLIEEKTSKVYESLSGMDKDAIKGYVSFISMLDKYSRERYMIDRKAKAKAKLLEDLKRENQEKYREYVNNYYLNNVKDKYTKGYFTRLDDGVEDKDKPGLNNDYYMVVLNNNPDGSEVKLDNNKSLRIFCKNINGKLYDVVTNDEYSFSKYENASKVSYITYKMLYFCDAEEVYEQLKNMDENMIAMYINAIYKFKLNAYKDNVLYVEMLKTRELLESMEREKDKLYGRYIDEFHDSYDEEFNVKKKTK